jgi:uncharacterized protein (TIGR04141 family)
MGEAPPTKRATLYRMLDGTTLESALLERYRESSDSFNVTDVTVESLDGRLVHGTLSSRTKWAPDVALLTGVALSNRSPGAILLIKDKTGVVWGLSWGIGFHFIDYEQIDFGFGSRVLARSAVPGEVKSLTKTVLDHRARVDRSSLPNGSTIRDLGVDGYGEVVSRIEAKARIPDLTVGDKPIQIRASDSVNLPLAKKSIDLVRDLKTLDVLLKGMVLPGLESLEQLVALKPKDRGVPGLEARLRKAIIDGDRDRIGMSWPHERLETRGAVASCKVTGVGDYEPRIYEQAPDISDVMSWFNGMSEDDIEARLKTVRLELHGEAEPSTGTAVSQMVPLRRWLAAEFKDDHRRYCLHDGSWYRMDDQYLERIDSRVTEILDQPTTVELPAWPTNEHEEPYNKRAAALLDGYVLDRTHITTPVHSRGGIEPCDIFLPPGILIHVKRARRSADLSHLFAQALVSADSLARDEHARKAWTERITTESDGAIRNAGIDEVVLAMGRQTPVTVDSLFTFTKVNLVKQYDALHFVNVDVRVVTVLEK